MAPQATKLMKSPPGTTALLWDRRFRLSIPEAGLAEWFSFVPRQMVAGLACLILCTSFVLHAADPGQVLIYARWDTAARSWLPISCDGAPTAEIRQGRFFALDLTAGQHTLRVEGGVPVSLDLHAGTAFVRLDWNYAVGRSPIPILVMVREADARREMRNVSYVGPRRIHSAWVPTSDPSPSVEPQLRTRDKP